MTNQNEYASIAVIKDNERKYKRKEAQKEAKELQALSKDKKILVSTDSMDILLTPKEFKFIELFLTTGNATDAFINAGLAVGQTSNAKRTSHAQQASRLLKKPKIQKAIKEFIDPVSPQVLTDKLQRMINQVPDDDFKHDHLIKAITLLMKSMGMLKEDKSGATIRTMNILNMVERKSGQKGDSPDIVDIPASGAG